MGKKIAKKILSVVLTAVMGIQMSLTTVKMSCVAENNIVTNKNTDIMEVNADVLNQLFLPKRNIGGCGREEYKIHYVDEADFGIKNIYKKAVLNLDKQPVDEHLYDVIVSDEIISDNDVLPNESEEQTDSEDIFFDKSEPGTEFNLNSYGYLDLAKRTNGQSRQSLYREIYAFADNFHRNGTDIQKKKLANSDYYIAGEFDFAAMGLTLDEAIEVWVTFKNDNPMYYWVSGELAVSDSIMYIIVDEEYRLASERNRLNEIIINSVEQYRQIANEYKTKYEKVFAVHNKLCAEVDYAWDANGVPSTKAYAHNILGVFNNKKAVCEGYAKAFQLIMTEIGVENIYVTGTAFTQNKTARENVAGEKHSWNIVKLDDGQWHCVDLTWDDSVKNGYSYFYFCLGNSEFSLSHKINTPNDKKTDFLYELPAISEVTYTPVKVYKDDSYIMLAENIDRALAVVNDKASDYTLELCLYANEYSISAGTLPEAKSIRIKGNYVDLSDTEGEGKFYVDKIYTNGNITLSSELILENIDVEFYKAVANSISIILNDKKIIFEGKYCKLNADITGNEHSQICDYAEKIHFYGRISADKFILTNAYVSFLTGNAEINEISIEGNIKEVREKLLLQFNNVKTINIGKNVNFISSSAFIYQDKLECLNVDAENSVFFSEAGVIYEKVKNSDKIILKAYPCGKKGEEFIMPMTVKRIEDNAFYGNKNLKKIIIYRGAESIGNSAFAKLEQLEAIYLPSTVKGIADDAFADCKKLTLYVIMNSEANKIAKKNNIPFVIINEYTYTFLNYDGSVYKSGIGYENEIIRLPQPPTVPQSEYAKYVFLGWEGYTNGMKLTENVQFTPIYDEQIKQYVCKFLNEDGSIFYQVVLPYKSNILLPEGVPQKKSNVQFDYVFKGWSGYSSGMTISSDMTFEPLFEEKIRKYTYRFYDYDFKTVLKEVTADANSIIVPPKDPDRLPTDREKYTFIGWRDYEDGMLLNADIDFVAEFKTEPNVYTYKFLIENESGERTVVKSETLYFNSVIIQPDDPQDYFFNGDTYVFTGWNGYEYGMRLQRDIEFIAQFSLLKEKYRYVFYDYDMSIVKRGIVDKNEVILSPEEPVRDNTVQFSYKFIGWKGYSDGITIDRDMKFFAEYEEIVNNYTCMFVNDDGRLVEKMVLPYGTVIIPPVANKESTQSCTYEFIGWKGYTKDMVVTCDVIFVAEYNEIIRQCEYVFYNDDKSEIIASGSLPYGSKITAPATALKQANEKYYYVFAGWKGYTEGMIISSNLEFTAIFMPILNKYTYRFLTYKGEVIKVIQADWGTEIVPPAAPLRNGYEFSCWKGFDTGMILTQNVDFAAEYKLIETALISDVYTVDDKDFIKGIMAGTGIGMFRTLVKNQMTYYFFDADNKAVTDENSLICSGMTAKLTDDDGVVHKEYKLVVIGDVNGDGYFTITDFINIRDAIIGKTSDDIWIDACDINLDGEFTVTDILMAKNMLIG